MKSHGPLAGSNPLGTKYQRLRSQKKCQRCYAHSEAAYCETCTQARKERSILKGGAR